MTQVCFWVLFMHRITHLRTSITYQLVPPVVCLTMKMMVPSLKLFLTLMTFTNFPITNRFNRRERRPSLLEVNISYYSFQPLVCDTDRKVLTFSKAVAIRFHNPIVFCTQKSITTDSVVTMRMTSVVSPKTLLTPNARSLQFKTEYYME